MKHRLTRENFRGSWAGIPVAWDASDQFDDATYRKDVAACCAGGAPGVYTGGTSGEFYAMELDEFKRVAAATVETCRQHGTPSMIGCTSTYTLGAVRRAACAAECGADAIQVALPFWMAMEDNQIVPFFKEVSAAAPGLALSVYETRRTKKSISLDVHRAIKDAVPEYLMVKSNEDTLGVSVEGCTRLSEFVNVFVHEGLWAELGPVGAIGCCSSMIYWFPRYLLKMFRALEAKDWPAVSRHCAELAGLDQFLGAAFAGRGFTDTAYDRLGAAATGFLSCGLRGRGPYISPVAADVRVLRQWLEKECPVMLQ